MAELADAHGSGPCESNLMEVQVLLSAPNSKNPNLVPIGEGFGFLIYLDYPNFNSKFKLVESTCIIPSASAFVFICN